MVSFIAVLIGGQVGNFLNLKIFPTRILALVTACLVLFVAIRMGLQIIYVIFMDKNFFKKTRILDGGMGQELLNRGLKPKGTLWSAHALIDKECHQMVIDTHLDFINAGAEVIVTTTFTARRNRLIQNDCEKYFEKINIKAVELAQKARDISKKEVLIAGGLPNQKQTYSADLGEDLDLIKKNFYDQAKFLKHGIDFFYLDVMSSGLECEIALKVIESCNLPVLVGIHLKDNGQASLLVKKL